MQPSVLVPPKHYVVAVDLRLRRLSAQETSHVVWFGWLWMCTITKYVVKQGDTSNMGSAGDNLSGNVKYNMSNLGTLERVKGQLRINWTYVGFHYIEKKNLAHPTR